MGYMSEEEILQFVEEQMSIRDSNRIQELEVKVDKLEIMVRTLLDAFNETKESDIGKKKKN
tara:strand:- start:609 stop:791 length:183 start_codon:yes stop_codon:yes gene_type:complete